MPSEQPFPDQISLLGGEADIYEAIATLEYLGRPVGTAEIVAETRLDRDAVRESLISLTQRGVLIEHVRDGQAVYEPAYRGWSAAPEESTGFQG
ncbi:MAG: hypothetical protein ACTHJW_16550 [Streptosporangiaceae bacterium]